MSLEIRYFASLREGLGLDGERLDRPAGVRTLGDLQRWLAARGGVWAECLADDRPIRAALDQQMVGMDDLLPEQAEVAFFPPVTGG